MDPEALIKEARARHQRRRRRSAAVLLAVAVAAGVAVFALRSRSHHVPGIERVPGGPTVNVAAFAGHGRLAFISRNIVWVLDGEKRRLQRIPTTPGRYPLQPSFSPNGDWLAFVRTTTPPAYVAGGAWHVGQLWLARGDGSDARRVPGLANVQLVGWSSTRDVLAVVAGPVSRRVPFGADTTVRLVTPAGTVRRLVSARSVRGAVWSSDGRRLAVVTEDARRHDTLAAYPINGSRGTVWQRISPRTRLNGMSEILVDVAGWWRGLGIGLWVYGNGMTHNNDATPLALISAPGGKPRFLADTLSDQTTRVLAAGGKRLAVVADVSHGINGGRLVWDAKQVQICTSRGRCSPVIASPRNVTLDPAWSPDGARLAFVQAPDLTSSGWAQPVLQRWYAQHMLRLYDARTKSVTTLHAERGATVPVWSADGRNILYIASDGIWLLPRKGARPVEVASPLFKRSVWPAYYGQMAWPAQFAWWSK